MIAHFLRKHLFHRKQQGKNQVIFTLIYQYKYDNIQIRKLFRNNKGRPYGSSLS